MLAGARTDTLIAPNNISPEDPRSWDADKLANSFLGSRHDLVFLAGHFGTMIWLGFLFAVVGYAMGIVAGFTNKKMADIGASLQGPPTPEQATDMTRYRDRAILLAKIASLLVVAAVVTMAMAQHV